MQSAAVYNDFNALATLRSAARQDADASLEQVAKQFESLFVQMMLKSMRDATPDGGLFDSDQLDSYQQMHDQQLSLDLASRGGIGLAEVLVEQLRSDPASRSAGANEDADLSTHTIGETKGSQTAYELERYWRAPPAAVSVSPSALSVAASASALSPEGQVKTAFAPVTGPLSPGEFRERLAPVAEATARDLGVSAEVLLAQSALETGWGKHVIAGAQGSSNNFFNIKAGSEWTGPTVTVQTLEYRDGVAVRETARFRAYATPEASFADYASLIKESPRYSAAKDSAADAEEYLRELQRAGYATDPAYADKVLSIMARKDLAANQELKNAAELPLTL